MLKTFSFSPDQVTDYLVDSLVNQGDLNGQTEEEVTLRFEYENGRVLNIIVEVECSN